MSNYQDASKVLDEIKKEPLPPHLKWQLQLQFEHLVVLDYTIRNTGWLVGWVVACSDLNLLLLLLLFLLKRIEEWAIHHHFFEFLEG